MKQFIPTAPDVKTQVAGRIRSQRKSRDMGDRWFLPHRNAREKAGRFTTKGGALVLVEALAAFSQRAIWGSADHPDGYEHRIHVSAEAKCHGHGCIDPDFQQYDTGYFLLDADADVTAEAVLPYVHKAREWAQAHAETCRAQAYTD